MELDTVNISAQEHPFAPVETSKRNAILTYRASNPNATPAQIAIAVDANLQYVYSVLSSDRKSQKIKRKPGRPRKTESVLNAVRPAIKHDPELDNLRRSVSEHAHIVDGLKKEIEELTIIIAYLEHRCAKAEGGRGPAI